VSSTGTTTDPQAPVTPGIESTIRTVYIVPSSHLDIGFTAPADIVADDYKPQLDRALHHLDRIPDLVWNIEEVWMLEQWLSRTPDPTVVERLLAHIRAGRLGLLGGWATEHSALLDAAELAHFLYPAEALRQQYGLHIDTVLQNDVPGYSWTYPGLFAATGYRYFLTGLNLFIGGGTSISRADLPFHWQGADDSTILTWVNFDSYVEGFEQLTLHKGAIPEDKLVEAMRRYTDAGYPYDAILLQHSFDNLDIDGMGVPALTGLIREWNRTHANPQLLLATPGQFFQHMEAQYAGRFKTYRGDWAGRWEEVKVGSPAGHALVRHAKADLAAGAALNTLASLLDREHFTDESALGEQVDALYRDLLWWDEHSVGSPVPWPNYFTEAETNQDNRLRWEMAQKLSREAAVLREAGVTAIAAHVAGSEPGIVVVNPLAWERGGPVSLPWSGEPMETITATHPERREALVRRPESKDAAFPLDGPHPSTEGTSSPTLSRAPAQDALATVSISLRDEVTGEVIPVEVTGGQLHFIAPPVPSLGYRRLSAVVGPEAIKRDELGPVSAVAKAHHNRAQLENAFFRVIVDPATGTITSLYDKTAGRELMAGGQAFNTLVQAERGKSHPRRLTPVETQGPTTITLTRGVLADTLTIERAGSPFVRTTITLPADQPWLEWTNEADRSLMPEVPPGHASDLYLFGFHFNLPAGGLQFRPETPAGYLTPVADQLPGANGRGWTVQRSAALNAADGYTVVLAAVEPFLFYIGDAEGQGPYTPPANATIYAALMSKADYGLLKGGTWMKLADGEPSAPPVHRHTFRLHTQPAFHPVAASRAGWELACPLAAVSVPGSSGGWSPLGSFLSLDQPNVMLTELKPATLGGQGDGEASHIILRLQEMAGRATTVETESAFPVERAWLTTPTEQPIEELPVNPLRVPVAARAMVTLRLEM